MLYNLFPLFFSPLFRILQRRELRQQVLRALLRQYVTRTTLTEPARAVVPRGSFSSFSLHGRARYTRAFTFFASRLECGMSIAFLFKVLMSAL